MNSKFSLTVLALGLSSIALASNASDTPINDNISYNFAEAGIGIGKTKFKTQGNTFNFKTNTLGLTLSHKIQDNTYIKFSTFRARTDDSDIEGGTRADLNDTDIQSSALLGFYVPLDFNFHLIGEAGINHAKSKSSITLSPLTARATQKNSDTDFMWRVGFRSSWTDAFEMNANFFKSDDTRGWTVNGPMMLSKNLGLDIHYTHTKNTSTERQNKSKVIGASLRYEF